MSRARPPTTITAEPSGPTNASVKAKKLKLGDMGREVFSYQLTRRGEVRIFWEGSCVMTLGGERGRKLFTVLETADDEGVQRALQRVTGNFKRGNERLGKR